MTGKHMNCKISTKVKNTQSLFSLFMSFIKFPPALIAQYPEWANNTLLVLDKSDAWAAVFELLTVTRSGIPRLVSIDSEYRFVPRSVVNFLRVAHL